MAFLVLVAGQGQAAVVYTWTDSAGVVHYSDHAVPGATVVVTSTPSSGLQAGPATAPNVANQTRPAGAALDYTQFAISSPQAEQVFFSDDIVSATLQLEPALKAGQIVSWSLNGQMLHDQQGNQSITLPALPRGAYSVTATVTDPVSGTSRTTPGVMFYVRQPSELSPQHKKS